MYVSKLQHPKSPHRPGTAEIELLLCIPILLTILFLIGCMLTLGPARILNIFEPEPAAYRSAMASPTPAPDQNTDITLDPSFDILQQGANRLDLATVSKPVTLQRGPLSFPTITLTSQAAFISPSWSYASYPVLADQPLLEQWVEGYAAQSTAPYQDALGLQPPWTP